MAVRGVLFKNLLPMMSKGLSRNPAVHFRTRMSEHWVLELCSAWKISDFLHIALLKTAGRHLQVKAMQKLYSAKSFSV